MALDITSNGRYSLVSPRRDSLSGCPAGPAVPVRSAAEPSALTPRNVTKPAVPTAANSGASVAPRKPPTPVKEAPASVQQPKAANAKQHNH
jgi:hypothetical protein